MMPRTPVICLALMLLIGIATDLLAIGGNHPDETIDATHADWPEGLVDLINNPLRVHGYWVNQSDFFHYRGDADEFNAFVEEYGRLPETDPMVVIHVGNPLTGPLGEEETVPYDWRLDIIRRGWGVPHDPRRSHEVPGYVIALHVWLGPEIPLELLDIPRHVEIRSGGEVEEFIERHRE